MNKPHLFFILTLLLISIFQCQHYESFDTGITSLAAIPFNSSNSTYRTFSCRSSITILATNGSFVFSILSFNYFVKQAFCLKPVRNLTALNMAISCSPNVYRLSYMFFDKGPNVFLHYGERIYSAGKNFTDFVDISRWMGQVKFPLKSLVKTSTSNQYEIVAESFISGVSLFQNPFNPSLFVFNDFGKIKIEAVYSNITVDNETKLWVPVGVQISTSPTVEKVSFYSVIVIKQMISMNMNFQTIPLINDTGIQYMGHFAGISQMSFDLTNKQNSVSNDVSLNIDYNYKPSNTSSVLRRFAPEKLFSYKKGSNLNINYSIVSDIFYRRCINGSVYHAYTPELPKEGKIYKITSAYSTGLVWEVTPQGKIKFTKWANTQSQKFYFLHQVIEGINQVMIFSAMSNQTIRCQLSKVNDTLLMGDANESDSKGTWLLRSFKVNNSQIAYFEHKNALYRIGLENSTAFEGALLIQANNSAVFPLFQQFFITEIKVKNETITERRISYTSSVVGWKKTNFNYLNEIVQTGSYPSNAVFSYYSIEQQKCYDRLLLDSQIANTTLNNLEQSNAPAVLPYFMDINKTLSMETISRNANTSAINTSTLQFAQGYMYGLCINRTTLNSFFTQINHGWTGFVFDGFNQAFYQNTTNQTTQSNVSTNDVNKTEEKPLILMPTGCEKMKIVNISLMQYECELCQQTYVLHSYTNSQQEFNQSSLNEKKCICEMGYFMNQKGLCTLCTSHPTNCKPQIKISASIQTTFQTRLSISESWTLLITLQIINDRYKYSFMGPIESIYERMVAYVNGVNYTIEKGNVEKCTVQSLSENTSLCLNIHVDNIRKASQYMISVGSLITFDENPIDSYLLINETQQLTDQLSDSVSDSYMSVASNDTSSSLSTQLISQPVSKLYFSKIQTYEVVVPEPFTAQKFVSNIQPLVQTLNYSSSVVMIAAPFLMDKINIYSLLQTNSLLYMMSFLKFNQDNSKQSQIQSVAQKLFIFRPEPFFKPFSLKSNLAQSSPVSSYIQIPRYSTQFQNNFIYNQSLSSTLGYPETLYKKSISSLNGQNGDQNYMTLTLNALVNMGLQILLMEIFMFLVIWLYSTVTEKELGNQGEENGVSIKKKIQYDIKRQKFVNLLQEAVGKTWEYKNILKGKQGYDLMTQKPIEWLSMPEMKDCEKVTILQNHKQKQVENSTNQIHETSGSQQHPFHMQQEEEPSLKQQILFFVTGFKQKRFIFYSSFIMIQLISQSYLLYFELVKPLDSTSDDAELNVFNYFDTIFGMTMMFFFLVFPAVLINYEPLHLLKIVAIIPKMGGYKFHQENGSLLNINKDKKSSFGSKDFLKNSYTYEEIYFDFCIIYYEIMMIPFSIAIGSNILYQTLPITFYQVFKFFWMYKKLKILEKIKILTLFFVFGLSGSWDYIGNQYVKTKILSGVIIWGMYIVLFIEFAKLFKFFVVFLMKALRLKKDSKEQSENEASQKSKKPIKSRSSERNDISILAMQEQPNFNLVKQISEVQEFESEQHMIEKKNSIEKKRKKLEALKQKSVVLNEIAKVRQNLRENLEYMRNRRKQVIELAGK